MSFGQFENVGSFIRDCNGDTLRYDQACLQVITNEKVSLWSQYLECEECALLETKKFGATGQIVIDTNSPLTYSLRNGVGEICNGTYQFSEYGQYQLNLTDVTSERCQPKMTAEPDAARLPILTAVVILLSMATLWYIVKGIGKRIVAGRLYARYFAREDNELGSETRVLTAEASLRRAPARCRLRSLDILRGITISLMIFVNSGGGGYSIFAHSTWNGLTVADVVAPWFAFTMGQALVLSLNGRLRTSVTRCKALQQVARRSLYLCLIGFVLSSTNVSLAGARAPGVLQRLAVMYLVVGALECAFMRTSQNITPGNSLLRDISAGWQQWLGTLILVATQVCITFFVAAPGCPRGYMGPGGLHMTARGDYTLQNCTGGIAGYIDRVLLGPSHLYRHGTFARVYHTVVPHDPEGILGALSGVLVVQAGAHASRIMTAYNHARARITRLVLYALVFGLTGGALTLFTRSDGPIPLNKNLWSLSYCLVTAAMAFFLQAVLYYVVDLKNRWGGRPFYYAGQNALILYIGSELLKRHVLFYFKISYPTHTDLLAANTLTTLLWLAVAIALHRKRVFITV